ncbi:MAG: response regulator [Nitrospinae bacterium]|nr:response regulator [Nitrospinota bacterium]
MEKRVLIVDDDEDTQMLLDAVLKKEGWITSQAWNGEQCLSMLEEVSPDVILLDYSMPGMDGREVLFKIKEKGCNIPVIAITAFTIEKLPRDFLELGAFDFLSKPLKKSDLVFSTTKAFNYKTLWDQLAKYKEKDYDFTHLEENLAKIASGDPSLEMGRYMLLERQKSYGLEQFFSFFVGRRRELQNNVLKLEQFVDSLDSGESEEAKAACGSISEILDAYYIAVEKTAALLDELKSREERFKKEDEDRKISSQYKPEEDQ